MTVSSNFDTYPTMFDLPNKGYGTVSVLSQQGSTELSFDLSIYRSEGCLLSLKISPEMVTLYIRQDGKLQPRLRETGPNVGLNLGRKTLYWLSLDSKSGVLRYGKYFPNRDLTLYEAFLKPKAASEGRKHIVWDNYGYSQLEQIALVEVSHTGSDGVTRLWPSFVPIPVICDLPPVITPPEENSMSQLDGGKYVLPSSLHPACQELYEHISGPNISLNDNDFPDFADAIQHSIETKGFLLHSLLRNKAAVKGEQREATKAELEAVTTEQLRAQYLRITLGCHKGNSPGVPFVLEVWPGYHHSSIHHHDGACAIIKVLHGEIKCQWYKSLEPALPNGEEATFKEGQVTWMSPQYYQVHKLRNPGPKVCCAIQCYQYPQEATPEFESDRGFHVVNQQGNISRFELNSDMKYGVFRDMIKEEWERKLGIIKF